MNRTIIIVSLVLSVISLIIILLDYFGLLRYGSLYMNSSEKYIENYSKLDKANINHRTVVSLTTTPENIDKIHPVLNSLLDQTVKVDQITLNIPKDKEYIIPPVYKKMINIFKSGKDYGAGQVYVPTLLREGEKETEIICVSDSYIYGKDFIESIVSLSSKYMNSAVECKGAIFVKPKFFSAKGILNNSTLPIKDNLNVNVVEVPYIGNYGRL